MTKYTDNHTHFTGSLPLEFVCGLLQKRKLPLHEHQSTWRKVFGNLDYDTCLDTGNFDNKYLAEIFRVSLSKTFNSDPKHNIQLFFDIYSLFQYWTKSNDLNEVTDLFVDGTEAIAKDFYQDGTRSFEIIAGPLIDWQRTKLRIDSMIAGLNNAERKLEVDSFGKIRLTYIKNRDGLYINYFPLTLTQILDKIEFDQGWEDKISGFDFSGTEVAKDYRDQFEILGLINKYNKLRIQSGKHRLPISVHAGEDVINNKPSDLLDYFEKLIETGIDRIGHCTFLWLPEKYLRLSKAENRQRSILLEQLASKNIEIEICPTTNLLLSPLSAYSEISLDKLDRIGVAYTINTDNRTILSTNIKKELNAVKLSL